MFFIFLRTFLQKGSQTLQKTFGQRNKLNILFAFQSSLGRSDWYIVLAENFALPQSRGPVRTPPCAPYLYKAIYKRLQNIGNDREEHVARTKVCGSAKFLTDMISRAARPSKARKVSFIFSLAKCFKSFLKEFEGTFCKKFPQEKHINYNLFAKRHTPRCKGVLCFRT